MKKRKLWFIACAVLVILVLVGMYVFDFSTLLLRIDLQMIQDIAGENLMWVLLVLLVIMILQNLFSIMPLILVITANISLLGWGYGLVWAWLTGLIGSMIGFYLSRFWLQGWLAKNLNPKWADKIELNGFKYVLIARVFPFVPKTPINIAAGMTSIKVRDYFTSTALGNFIYYYGFALIAYSWTTIMKHGILTGVVLIVATVIAGYVWRFIRVKKGKAAAVSAE